MSRSHDLHAERADLDREEADLAAKIQMSFEWVGV
jgi:hypothetical protein